jgi:CheY-like chemotaxis protein
MLEKNILVTDDDQGIRDLFEEVLRNEGYQFTIILTIFTQWV